MAKINDLLSSVDNLLLEKSKPKKNRPGQKPPPAKKPDEEPAGAATASAEAPAPKGDVKSATASDTAPAPQGVEQPKPKTDLSKAPVPAEAPAASATEKPAPPTAEKPGVPAAPTAEKPGAPSPKPEDAQQPAAKPEDAKPEPGGAGGDAGIEAEKKGFEYSGGGGVWVKKGQKGKPEAKKFKFENGNFKPIPPGEQKVQDAKGVVKQDAAKKAGQPPQPPKEPEDIRSATGTKPKQFGGAAASAEKKVDQQKPTGPKPYSPKEATQYDIPPELAAEGIIPPQHRKDEDWDTDIKKMGVEVDDKFIADMLEAISSDPDQRAQTALGDNIDPGAAKEISDMEEGKGAWKMVPENYRALLKHSMDTLTNKGVRGQAYFKGNEKFKAKQEEEKKAAAKAKQEARNQEKQTVLSDILTRNNIPMVTDETGKNVPDWDNVDPEIEAKVNQEWQEQNAALEQKHQQEDAAEAGEDMPDETGMEEPGMEGAPGEEPIDSEPPAEEPVEKTPEVQAADDKKLAARQSLKSSEDAIAELEAEAPEQANAIKQAAATSKHSFYNPKTKVWVGRSESGEWTRIGPDGAPQKVSPEEGKAIDDKTLTSDELQPQKAPETKPRNPEARATAIKNLSNEILKKNNIPFKKNEKGEEVPDYSGVDPETSARVSKEIEAKTKEVNAFHDEADKIGYAHDEEQAKQDAEIAKKYGPERDESGKVKPEVDIQAKAAREKSEFDAQADAAQSEFDQQAAAAKPAEKKTVVADSPAGEKEAVAADKALDEPEGEFIGMTDDEAAAQEKPATEPDGATPEGEEPEITSTETPPESKTSDVASGMSRIAGLFRDKPTSGAETTPMPAAGPATPQEPGETRQKTAAELAADRAAEKKRKKEDEILKEDPEEAYHNYVKQELEPARKFVMGIRNFFRKLIGRPPLTEKDIPEDEWTTKHKDKLKKRAEIFKSRAQDLQKEIDEMEERIDLALNPEEAKTRIANLKKAREQAVANGDQETMAAIDKEISGLEIAGNEGQRADLKNKIAAKRAEMQKHEEEWNKINDQRRMWARGDEERSELEDEEFTSVAELESREAKKVARQEKYVSKDIATQKKASAEKRKSISDTIDTNIKRRNSIESIMGMTPEQKQSKVKDMQRELEIMKENGVDENDPSYKAKMNDITLYQKDEAALEADLKMLDDENSKHVEEYENNFAQQLQAEGKSAEEIKKAIEDERRMNSRLSGAKRDPAQIAAKQLAKEKSTQKELEGKASSEVADAAKEQTADFEGPESGKALSAEGEVEGGEQPASAGEPGTTEQPPKEGETTPEVKPSEPDAAKEPSAAPAPATAPATAAPAAEPTKPEQAPAISKSEEKPAAEEPKKVASDNPLKGDEFENYFASKGDTASQEAVKGLRAKGFEEGFMDSNKTTVFMKNSQGKWASITQGKVVPIENDQFKAIEAFHKAAIRNAQQPAKSGTESKPAAASPSGAPETASMKPTADATPQVEPAAEPTASQPEKAETPPNEPMPGAKPAKKVDDLANEFENKNQKARAALMKKYREQGRPILYSAKGDKVSVLPQDNGVWIEIDQNGGTKNMSDEQSKALSACFAKVRSGG